MIKNKKIKLGLVALILVSLGIGIGRFSKPAEVITEIKEKEVIKYVEKRDEKKNVKIVKKKITNTDGSTIEVETLEDNSSSHSHISNTSTKESEYKQKVKNTSGLTLSALVLARDVSVQEYEFGIAVSKRVFSNVAVGVIVTEKRAVGVTVGLEF
jgi:hypothetical protein